jgi:hypothetical protein
MERVVEFMANHKAGVHGEGECLYVEIPHEKQLYYTYNIGKMERPEKRVGWIRAVDAENPMFHSFGVDE